VNNRDEIKNFKIAIAGHTRIFHGTSIQADWAAQRHLDRLADKGQVEIGKWISVRIESANMTRMVSLTCDPAAAAARLRATADIKPKAAARAAARKAQLSARGRRERRGLELLRAPAPSLEPLHHGILESVAVNDDPVTPRAHLASLLRAVTDGLAACPRCKIYAQKTAGVIRASLTPFPSSIALKRTSAE
jgi:hypothetical protein